MTIKVELKQETINVEYATVLISQDGKQIAAVVARVQPLQGADGQQYPAVQLSAAMAEGSNVVIENDDPRCNR